jgi:hypothetical protein
MPVFLGDKKKKKAKIKLSKSARTTLHPLTRIPKRVVEINRFPIILKKGTVPLTKDNVKKVFKAFIKENQEFFGIDSTNLKLKSAKKVRKKWYAKFQQYYKGIPVYKATVGLDASEQGKMNTYAAKYHPNIDAPTSSEISLEKAVEIAKETYPKKKQQELKKKYSVKIIYPKKKDKKIEYHLAWKFLIKGKRPDPEIENYFIVDAIDGKILFKYTARFPDASVKGWVRGEIYPENPTDAVTTVPINGAFAKVYLAGEVITVAGNYQVIVPSWWPILVALNPSLGRCTFKLDGGVARVMNNNGRTYRETRRCNTHTNCNHTWTATDRDHINVYYHMYIFHKWLIEHLSYIWRNNWDGSRRFNAEVNHPDNNAFAGDPMIFGTDNFARSSDVIYHECTHNVLVDLYGNYIGWPARWSEAYAMDEGFADYFACSFTNDSRMGEGVSATPRNKNNNEQYPGRANYIGIEGHDGGEIIGGAAWDLRERMRTAKGARGVSIADNLIFDANKILATYPRDYFFSDPHESNFLSSLYEADDDNNNLVDGVPNFTLIHHAFADHNLLQAILNSQDSFDFTANMIGELTGGDLYYYDGKFWANNAGQRGVKDLGNIGNVPLRDVRFSYGGYTRFGVSAVVGNTYISLAHQGEEGNWIAFRVTDISADNSEVTIEYYYHKARFGIVEGGRINVREAFTGHKVKGDFYYEDGKFFSDEENQRGIIDLGDLGDVPLEEIKKPLRGYTRKGVPAIKGNTYVAKAKKTEGKHYIVFRVHSIKKTAVTIDLAYI